MCDNSNTTGGVNHFNTDFRQNMVFCHISRLTARQIALESALKIFYVTTFMQISGDVRASENLFRRLFEALFELGNIETETGQQINHLESPIKTLISLLIQQFLQGWRIFINIKTENVH